MAHALHTPIVAPGYTSKSGTFACNRAAAPGFNARLAASTEFFALVGFEEWSYIVFSLWLSVAGAGPLSLDNLVTRWLRRRQESSPHGDLPKPLLRPQTRDA